MKAINLIVLLVLFLDPEAQGQEFAPVGSKWYYTNIESFFSPAQGYVTIEYTRDTTIQGLNCKILKEVEYRSYGTSIDPKRLEYLYVKGDTVWRYSDDNNFYILYNFSANVGDSWVSKSYDVTYDKEIKYEVTVDNVRFVSINGYNLKVMNCSTSIYYFQFGGEVIQLLGGVQYMFPFNYGFLDCDIRRGLRCYSDPEFGHYNTGLVENCDELISATIDPLVSNDKIKIFHNPASGKLSIELNRGFRDLRYINIYTLDGRLIDKIVGTSSKEKYSIEFYKSGLYIFEFVGNHYRMAKKAVVN